jgi:NAD(P)H dehydrogenase (quinone)
MAISVLLAHPRPGSFNHAIAENVVEALRAAGRVVNFHDLYAERFDPLFPSEELAKGEPADAVILAHCRQIVEAEGIVVVHPNWWGQPPAVLKGWLDRALRQGMAYEFRANAQGQIGPVGLLQAKAAVVFTTGNTPQDQEDAIYGDPLENLWKTCVFGFCGVKNFRRRNYTPVVVSSPEQRQDWLRDARQTALDALAS